MTSSTNDQVNAGNNQKSAGFDVIIVGGGSAGAVLANRLSEDADRRVLLVEAGKAYPPHAYPDAVRLQTVIGGDPGHDWGYTSETGWGERSFPVPRGKVLGGSSAVNAGVWMRAPAVDFERWTEAGLPHWSMADVLPFFQSSENGFGHPGHQRIHSSLEPPRAQRHEGNSSWRQGVSFSCRRIAFWGSKDVPGCGC